ncbi:metallophosphoesterase family protein [Consotaella aegiceratis]|uniref:metallophosphoesterase family protein n=1 Tax=Consotaella aegiceratis TaxID=3097961 RepID=UPI002F40840A
MASFKFLHAADLHLGSPFVGLSLKDAEIAARFAAASRQAFTAMVTRAIEADIAFAIIAGDVYDGEWRDTSIGLFFNREVSRFIRAGIPVFLIRGNHDAESVVTKSLTLPEGVYGFSTRKAETRRLPELRVALHGQSFPDRAVAENLATAYPDPVPGWFNIGILHTSLDGRPGHATYAPCTLQDLALRTYDYWALGHVHQHEIVARDPWVVFPGNLQGRSVRETGEKGAMLVEVEDGRVASAERLIVDRARWADLALDVSEIVDEAGLITAVQERLRPLADELEDRLGALRLRLTGASELHNRLVAEHERIAAEVQAVCHHGHADIWLERLVVSTQPPAAVHGPTDDPALASVDVAALLAAASAEPDIRAELDALLAQIGAKLPAGVTIGGEEAPDVADLLGEARDLVLAHSGGAI